MTAPSLSDARTVTLSRGGKWYGNYGTTSCPICQPEGRIEQNALTLSNCGPRLLTHCKKDGCAFREIICALALEPRASSPQTLTANNSYLVEKNYDTKKRRDQVLRLWNDSNPIYKTPAETYLRGRGITCTLPSTLRYHAKAWHLSGRHLPAMVARVDGCDDLAVHRTYLLPNGDGKADTLPQKAMLGSVKGGAVQLTSAAGPLVVAEGIETALSLASGVLQRQATIWAALSTSGIRCLRLPEVNGCLIVATDGDDAGKAAGQALAKRAANLGWEVSLLSAPDGCDWNDVLRLKGSRHDRK